MISPKEIRIDFDKWTVNITCSVWGRGKATLVDEKLCKDDNLTGGAKYKGDCDECRWFMGLKNLNANTSWGDWKKGCCWLLVEDNYKTILSF